MGGLLRMPKTKKELTGDSHYASLVPRQVFRFQALNPRRNLREWG